MRSKSIPVVALGVCLALQAGCGNAGDRVGLARRTKAKTQMSQLKNATSIYLLTTGALPEKLDDLKKPIEKFPEGVWDGNFEDPWGHTYQYEKSGPRKFMIRSPGKDGKPGGEGEDADIDSDHLEFDR